MIEIGDWKLLMRSESTMGEQTGSNPLLTQSAPSRKRRVSYELVCEDLGEGHLWSRP